MKKSRFYTGTIFLGDIVIFYLSLYLALFMRRFSIPDLELYHSLIFPFFFLFLFWLLFLFVFNLYEGPFFKPEHLKNITLFTLFSLFVGVAYFYLQPQLQLTPRAVLILTALNSVVLLSLWRYFFSFIYGRENLKDKVVIIGSCPEVEEIADKDLGHLGYDITAVFTKKEVVTEKVIRSFAELEEHVKRADIVVLAPEVREDKKLIKNIFETIPLKINYMEFSGFYEIITRKIPLYSVDELWLLENISSPRNKIDKMIRRLTDLVISVFGLFFTTLLFPFIFLMIKIDSRGSVFYKQERVGLEGKKFTLYKFRTMHEREEGDNPWREKEKGQITRVGGFLRKTHLDEFPQFYNLFKGNVGVVGPRPEWSRTAAMFEKEIPFYHLRHLVRPGITGWAQLNYSASKSIEEAKEKFKYDLYYIKNRSLFLDIIILLKTLRTIF